MCKYEMDPTSIVKDTERTRFCPQMDGQTDGQGETSIPRFQLRWSGGYNKSALVHAMGLQRTGKMPLWLEQWWASSQDSLLIHMSAAGFSELIKQQCGSCIDWQKQGQHTSYQECPFFWSQQDTSWATREKTKIYKTRATRTPAFWQEPALPHDYPYYQFILDPFHSKSKLHCAEDWGYNYKSMNLS